MKQSWTFYVEGKGFTAAKELAVGDEVRLEDGSVGIVEGTETITLDNPVKVYNFEVEDFHTYYVSEQKVLVHNTCAVTARNNSKKVVEFQVGMYKDIKGTYGMDAHHVGQKALMKKFVDNYDYNTAPAINVPKMGHTILGPNGIVSRNTEGIMNARQLLARDIRELRRVYNDVPNTAIKELIDMNKKMYSEMRK